MKSPFELLDTLNRTDETPRVEAKDSRSGDVGNSVYKTLSAFSNEPGQDGGYLLFGVERGEGGEYDAVGIANPDKLQSDLSSMCSEFNVAIRPNLQVEEQDGTVLISAFVPEADISGKPVYREVSGLNDGTFRRNGSTDVKCSDSDLQEFFLGRDNSDYDYSFAAKNLTLNDLDPDAIGVYREKIEQRQSTAQVVDWTDENLLLGRNCLRENDGEFVPTIAGLVLFGKKSALRRAMPMASRIDYIRVPGRSWNGAKSEIESTTYWGGLITTIPQLVGRIVDALPQRFEFPSDSIERLERPAIPVVALREAVVNAVMHRDYRRNSSIQIVRYVDRVEIANPGYSLKSPERFRRRGSALRNPNLATVLYEMHLAETMGSGIGRVCSALDDAGLPKPLFENSRRDREFSISITYEPAVSEAFSSGKGGSNKESNKESNKRLRSNFSDSLVRKIKEVQETRDASILRGLIIRICSVEPHSGKELATLLCRTSHHLRTEYLAPMVEDGVLELTHPEKPRHPKQAYRATSPSIVDDD